MSPSAAISGVKSTGNLLWSSLQQFMGDGCPRMAAALSYYTVFSLPPLLVLLMLIAGVFIEPAEVQRALQGQIGALLGPDGANQVQTIISNANRPGTGGPVAVILGIAAFLFGATGAFAQLQGALNAAWEVEPDPTRGDLKNFLFQRVFSFAMILAIGFLLLVSLVLSALIAAFTDVLTQWTPAGLSGPLLQAINTGISFVVISLLFAAMLKTLPDAVVAWRDAAVGGAFTALLFNLGKLGIGLYLGRSNPGSAYGAAGSLALVLFWIYASSLIVLFGAEFTQAWAERRGRPIEPKPGAVRIVRSKERVEKRGHPRPKSSVQS